MNMLAALEYPLTNFDETNNRIEFIDLKSKSV